MPLPRVDYVGHTFNRLTVLQNAPDDIRTDGSRDRRVIARCECGGEGNGEFARTNFMAEGA